MNKKIFIFIIILFSLSLISAQEYVPEELIIKYKDHPMKSYSSFSTKSIEKENKIEILKFKNGEDIEKKAKEYSKFDNIEYAEPNYIYYTFEKPNDPYYDSQWYLPKISSEEAWNLTRGNESIIIAIIDTGVQWNHSDLENNIWNNTEEDCNISTDKDKNGYFGDCRGYDFVNIQNESECSSITEDCNDTDNNPYDQQGHGTHCAGISAASTNNTLGIAGICPNCKIMPIRAGYNNTRGQGSLTTTAIVNAINYASENNATIISMSFGGDSISIPIQTALNNAYNKGIILVAAAGNDNSTTRIYPAAYNNVISVGATNSSNTKSSFSNYGTWVNIAAPGSNILSTYLSNQYISGDGTSMATPLIAGAIGLIKSIMPNKNQTEILTALNNTGESIDFITNNLSRINIFFAILSLDELVPQIQFTSPIETLVKPQNIIFTCNATDNLQLTNLTLKIYNETNLYYNKTISANNKTLELNQSVNLLLGNYEYFCESYDNASKYNKTENKTISTEPIIIQIISPENNTYTNQNETTFNCSAETIDELSNITFYLYENDSLIYNLTNSVSGPINYSIFNYNFTNETNYIYNCMAFSNESNSSQTENYTITYDITKPTITLTSLPSSTTSNSISRTFGFNVSDNNLANCSLIINENISMTNFSINSSLEQSFIKTFTPGTYNWKIECTDLANNTNNSTTYNLEISTPTPPSRRSSSSHSPSSSTPPTTEITEEEIKQGTIQQIKEKSKIEFTIKNQKHELTLNSLNTDKAKITIQSNPINLTIYQNQPRKINLDNDKFYDLELLLLSIENQEANIFIMEINETISMKQIFTNETISSPTPIEETPKLNFFQKIIQFFQKILNYFKKQFSII